jgi:hypothetical protein
VKILLKTSGPMGKTMILTIILISILDQPHRAFSNINFKNTSTKKIENVIRSLKAKESHGYDEITTKILKIAPPLLALL